MSRVGCITCLHTRNHSINPPPTLAVKTISIFRRLPESLHALGRDPAIYVLIKHFLVDFCSEFGIM
jgi:hypothetical protein